MMGASDAPASTASAERRRSWPRSPIRGSIGQPSIAATATADPDSAPKTVASAMVATESPPAEPRP